MSCSFLVSALVAQNQPPASPVITEPLSSTVINPYDLHMETGPFQDPDPNDSHAATDWEVWTVSPSARVWHATGLTGPEKLHAHLGDGVFTGSHSGWTRLFGSTQYQLRVRHMDDSGDPVSQWSAWATRNFTTAPLTQVQPLQLDDVAAAPVPRWTDAAGVAVDLPAGIVPASMALATDNGQLLLQVDGTTAAGNVVTNPQALAQHRPVRLTLTAGLSPLLLPPTDLAFAEHAGCETVTILLPAVSLIAGQSATWWVSREGATYVGSQTQTTPTFATPARNLVPPYAVRQPGYSIDVVADGLTMPINLAFKPNAGSAPGDAKFYVTELYGQIKTVTRDGTVLTYATGLLNYAPSGQFPGSGEQGLTGIAVDPITGDVFAAMLWNGGAANYPRIVRLTSVDGGRTSSSRTVILDMVGESQGQSHQISNLEIVGGHLYAHMGDGFAATTARSLSSYRGKILRLNLDGSPVPTNPYYNGGTRNARDYIYALGVRNPFGGAWRAADNSRYMVENGPAVDRFARLVQGRDYLWAGSDANMSAFALYNWSPATGPVNLAFVQPQTFGGSGFPVDKMDHAFVTESGPTWAEGQQGTGKRITEWVLDAAGNRVLGPVPFVEYVGDGRGSCIGLAAGPDGLYFTEFYRDLNASSPTQGGGRVLRIRHGSAADCNGNGATDWCEIATGALPDCNGNGVLDVCDLANGTSRDFDGNGVPDECDPLSTDRDRLSAATGGAVQFTLRAGQVHAGRWYVVLGTLSGTSPGQGFGAVTLPLNPDFWFDATVGGINSAWFQNSLGLLDGNGGGAATLVAPLIPPALVGMVAHHAYLIHDATTLQFVLASNAVPLTLTP